MKNFYIYIEDRKDVDNDIKTVTDFAYKFITENIGKVKIWNYCILELDGELFDCVSIRVRPRLFKCLRSKKNAKILVNILSEVMLGTGHIFSGNKTIKKA